MRKIKLPHLTIMLCALFATFSLGYWMGGHTQSGTYAILTEDSQPIDEPSFAVLDAPSAEPGTDPGTQPGTDPAAPPQPSAATTSGDATPAPPTPQPTVRDGRIDINAAGAEELTDLPGIGPVLAQRIVDYRNANGPFAAPGDIIQVSGIGPKKLEALLPLIKTGG